MAKCGRKPKEYNPDHAKQAKVMAQYGVPYEDIAACLSVCPEILSRLYKKELAEGRAVANAKIGKRLFEKAMEGDVSTLIFLAKVRLKMRTDDKKNDTNEAVMPKSIKVQVINGRVEE